MWVAWLGILGGKDSKGICQEGSGVAGRMQVHNWRVVLIGGRYYYGKRGAKFREKIFRRAEIRKNEGNHRKHLSVIGADFRGV